MSTLLHPPAIEASAPEEQQEAPSSTTGLLVGMAWGLAALAAVHLVGYAALTFMQVLRGLFGQG